MTEKRQPTVLLEMSDVARLLEISYTGVYMLVKAGKLQPTFRTRRGVRLFAPELVEAFRLRRQEFKRLKGEVG